MDIDQGRIGSNCRSNKLQDLIAGIDVKLTMEEIKYLEQEYKPSAVIGHC